MITTRIGQAKHLGKWDSHVAMIRLVRELQAKLEEADEQVGSDNDAINNVLYAFMGALPAKVADEVREG